MILTYNNLVKYLLREKDFQEIKEMPEPNENQVEYVKQLWDKILYTHLSTDHIIFNAACTGKLYIKCKESSPEYFI